MTVLPRRNSQEDSSAGDEKIKFGKRSYLEIISDILSLCKNKRCKQTRIMHKCNLSYTQLQTYLEHLTELHLLTITENEEAFYQITERGQEFLEKFQDLAKNQNWS